MRSACRQAFGVFYVLMLLCPCTEVLARGEFLSPPHAHVGSALLAVGPGGTAGLSYKVDQDCVNKLVSSDRDALAKLHNLARFYTAVFVAAQTSPPAQRLGVYLLNRLLKEMYPTTDTYIADIKAVAGLLERAMTACATRVDAAQPTTAAAVTVPRPGASLTLGHGRHLAKWPKWLFAKVPGYVDFDWDPLTVGLGLAIGVSVGATAALVAPVAAGVMSAGLVALGVSEGVAAITATVTTGIAAAEWASYTSKKLDQGAADVLNLRGDRKRELEVATAAGVLLTDAVDFATNAAEASWEGLQLGRRVWNPTSQDPAGLSSLVNKIVGGVSGGKARVPSAPVSFDRLANDMNALRVLKNDVGDVVEASGGGESKKPSSEGKRPEATVTPRSSGFTSIPRAGCTDLAGHYAISADKWTPAAELKPCPKLVKLQVLPDCKVVITDVDGDQLTSARYIPGSPNPWQGSIDFDADWFGKGGRAWSTKNAANPGSLELPCRDRKTGQLVGTWSYSIPAFAPRAGGSVPQGWGPEPKKGATGGDVVKPRTRFESVCSSSDCEACRRGSRSCATDTCCCRGHCGF